jgi:hypothetical protein
MRKPEQRLWDRLRKAAVGKIYTERIENLVGVGRPDLDTLVAGSFVPIELKQIAAWPMRVGTRVMGERGLSQVQKNWHLTWRRWGGNSLVVIGVGQDVFTFDGALADNLNEFNTTEFKKAALAEGISETVSLLIKMGHKA